MLLGKLNNYIEKNEIRTLPNTIHHFLTPYRPFRYDLNQISYDHTVEVTNRFKRLDLIKCLKNYGQKFVTLYRKQ